MAFSTVADFDHTQWQLSEAGQTPREMVVAGLVRELGLSPEQAGAMFERMRATTDLPPADEPKPPPVRAVRLRDDDGRL